MFGAPRPVPARVIMPTNRENLLYTMKNRGQPFIYHEYHRQGTSLTHGPLSLPALREVIESHRRTSVRGGEVFGSYSKLLTNHLGD